MRAVRPIPLRAGFVRFGPHALTAALVFVFGLPTIIFPLWPDHATFAVIGQAIAEGRFPYVDAWDQKPPAIYLIFAVAIQGPFGLVRNVHLFDLAWTAATVAVLVELGRRWWTLRAGVIAGLIYGAVYLTISGWWQLAQPDSFIGLPLVLALLLHDAARGRRTLLLGAGLLLGFAFQLRFIVVLLIPFFPLPEVAAAAGWRQRSRLWLQRMLWLGTGFLAVQLLLVLYLAAGGALGEYIAASRFATGYTRLGGPWQGPDGPNVADYLDAVRLSFLYWAMGRLVLTAPAVVGGFYASFVLNERRMQRLVLFVVLAYVGIAAQAKFFWYHFSYMLPFLALLAAWTYDRTFCLLRRSQPRLIAVSAAGVLVGGLLLSTPDVLDTGWHQWQTFVTFVRHPERREAIRAQFPGYVSERDTIAHLRGSTRPGDYIYVWGYDPLVYLETGTRSSSRFIYSLPLMSDWAPASWQDEFMQELLAHPPAYFVVERNQGGPWITGHPIESGEFIRRFPALERWLAAGYEYEAEFGDFVLYRRKGTALSFPGGTCAFHAKVLLAERIAEGARHVEDAEVELFAVEDQPIGETRPGEQAQHVLQRRAAVLDRLIAADAVIVGAPSYFGTMASPVKRLFEDLIAATPPPADRAVPWHLYLLHDKVAAAFTSSATPHGGNEQTLHSILTMLMHMGMIIVTPGQGEPVQERDAAPYGPTATSGPRGDRTPDLATQQAARDLGERVAEVTGWLKEGRRARIEQRGRPAVTPASSSLPRTS